MIQSDANNRVLARRLAVEHLPHLELKSADFKHGATLPTRATADGDGTPPSLAWGEPPDGTRSFALICEDPDAPSPEPFVHWLVSAIPGSVRSLDANVSGFREGNNSRSSVGFTPAAPPKGHGSHQYHFQLFALDQELSAVDGMGREALARAMSGHVLAWGSIVGTYEAR